MSVGIQGGQNRLRPPSTTAPAPDGDSLKEGVGEIAGTAVERGRLPEKGRNGRQEGGQAQGA